MARTNSRAILTDLLGNVEKVDLLKGYENNDIDEASSPQYYGFTDGSGNWFIRKINSGSSTFVRGTSNYSTNWTNRVALSYDTFDNTF